LEELYLTALLGRLSIGTTGRRSTLTFHLEACKNDKCGVHAVLSWPAVWINSARLNQENIELDGLSGTEGSNPSLTVSLVKSTRNDVWRQGQADHGKPVGVEEREKSPAG